MPLVIVRHRAQPTWLNGQALLRAIQGLNLTLLVDAQHDRVLGRVQLQADNVDQFLNKLRIVGELECLHAVGLQAIGFPHALHHRGRSAQLGGQRTRASMGRCRRLLTGRLANNVRRHFVPRGGGPAASRGIHAGEYTAALARLCLLSKTSKTFVR